MKTKTYCQQTYGTKRFLKNQNKKMNEKQLKCKMIFSTDRKNKMYFVVNKKSLSRRKFEMKTKKYFQRKCGAKRIL
jgi:hypothetical protein